MPSPLKKLMSVTEFQDDARILHVTDAAFVGKKTTHYFVINVCA